jgi:hypothetical protein
LAFRADLLASKGQGHCQNLIDLSLYQPSGSKHHD